MSRIKLSLAALCVSILFLIGCEPAPWAALGRGQSQTEPRSADGMEMIYVPAGEFLMGSTDADRKAADDEKPQHIVYLDAFWIDRTEVTNAQYVQFLNARGGHKGTCGGQDCIDTKVEDKESHIFRQDERYVVESGFKNHPVIEVTWYGAQAYCEWVGVRLPTEAEWEKAARGTDGRRYPWGSDAPDCRKAQYAECSGMTVAVGTRPAGASPYGALDMAGNVWEWVTDWYDAAYYAFSPAQNPLGPNSGERRVFRGGSWGYFPMFIRTTDRGRNWPTSAGFNLGFRCAAGSSFLPASKNHVCTSSHSGLECG
jgi:eukaryotic-like serine/threonine-protein kinase